MGLRSSDEPHIHYEPPDPLDHRAIEAVRLLGLARAILKRERETGGEIAFAEFQVGEAENVVRGVADEMEARTKAAHGALVARVLGAQNAETPPTR